MKLFSHVSTLQEILLHVVNNLNKLLTSILKYYLKKKMNENISTFIMAAQKFKMYQRYIKKKLL